MEVVAELLVGLLAVVLAVAVVVVGGTNKVDKNNLHT